MVRQLVIFRGDNDASVHSFFSGNGAASVTFTVSAVTLGHLPTQVGIVWTDGGISSIRISNTAGGIEVDHLQYGAGSAC
jgi:protein subunit release factor A